MVYHEVLDVYKTSSHGMGRMGGNRSGQLGQVLKLVDEVS